MAKEVFDEPSEEIVADAKSERAGKKGFFSRIALFLRQVMVEIKKVVTPTRKELITYTGVVLVFVVLMMAIVSALDLLFGWLVANVFGDGTMV